jgi:hypothetical protein
MNNTMIIEILLPQSFYASTGNEGFPQTKITANASNLHELNDYCQVHYPEIAHFIWDEDKKVKKNMIIVINDALINKSDYDKLTFTDNALIEIMTQFAGG